MPVLLKWLLRLGPTNPITVRLVQGGSRRSRHFYIRTAYLGLLMLVLLWALLNFSSGGALDYQKLASGGATSFQHIAYLQVALICMLAPVFMAGAIAQEANPRTWDILLTTPLGATEIVLGNLFGRLFFVLALLLSSLPLFAITQYFGGVPGRTIFASYLVAVCATFLVGSMAIALSVSRLVGKRAVFAFYVCVVSYLAVTWAADRVVASPVTGATGARGVSYMTGINPFLALRALLEPSNYPRAAEGSRTGLAAFMLESPVLAWCVLSGGLSLILLCGSVATVRAGGIAGVGGLTGRGEGGIPWYRRLFGLSGKGYEHRPPRKVWHNPIAWREAAARNATLGRMVARWSFIGLGAAWSLIILLSFHFGGDLSSSISSFRLMLLYTVVGELLVLTLVAINMAATSVAKEREDGTLDILLTTPITQAQYVSGKLRGMIAYLLPMLGVPIGTMLAAGAYVLAVQADWLAGPSVGVTLTQSAGIARVTDVPAILPEAGIVLGAVTIPFTALCIILGMQWSLKSKGTISSVIMTVLIIGVIAGTVGLCAFKAAEDLAVLGAGMGALSPGVAAFACVDPVNAMVKSCEQAGLINARLSLFIGSLVAGAIYLVIVYGIHGNMVRTFDMTVRKLAGESR